MAHQLLTGYSTDTCLESFNEEPSSLMVMEINHFKGRSTATHKVITVDALQAWLENEMLDSEAKLNRFGEVNVSRTVKEILTHARLNLLNSIGASEKLGRDGLRKSFPTFPPCSENRMVPLPFSKTTFQSILNTLHLPTATPWAFSTNSVHFHQYHLLGNYIGFTMRRHNRGLRGMDLALSLSYDTSTGITCGLLIGCDTDQQTFIWQQLQTLREQTRHPLLIPVFLLGQQQVLLHEETEALWIDLLRVENASGQTGVIVIPVDEQSQGGGQKIRAVSKDDKRSRPITNKQITNKVLGVVQLASTWESHIKALVQDIKAAKQSLEKVKSATMNNSGSGAQGTTPTATDRGIVGFSKMLEESLDLVMHKANTVLWDLEYINKRASAQMNAVYNHTARQIAVAAKQDSSDMKAIAILTMTFLPATFLATMFSMPFFNFPSTSTEVIKPAFRFYWALCVPLTVFVFCMYGLYVLWRQRKQHKDEGEDRPGKATPEEQGTEAAQTVSGLSDPRRVGGMNLRFLRKKVGEGRERNGSADLELGPVEK